MFVVTQDIISKFNDCIYRTENVGVASSLMAAQKFIEKLAEGQDIVWKEKTYKSAWTTIVDKDGSFPKHVMIEEFDYID